MCCHRFFSSFFAIVMILESLAIFGHTYLAFETARLSPIVSFTFPGWAFIMLLVGVGNVSNSKSRAVGGLKASAIATTFTALIFAVFSFLGWQRLQSDALKQDCSSMYLDASP